MREEHLQEINQAVAALESKKINSVYFTACGGSQAVLMPGQYIFDHEATLISQVYNANEFVNDLPKTVDEHAVVITMSHSGTTPETVAATKKAREAGAVTMAFSHEKESPLWQAAEFPIHYDWGTDADASDLNKAVFYGLIFKLLKHFTNDSKWDTCFSELNKLQDLTIITKNQYQALADQWGKDNKRDQIIYTIASGINYGEMYSTANCWFMEMQWINSAVIHSGEYFHGPFEITDDQVPFLMIKSIGNTRKLDQRVEDFAPKYTENLTVLDQADLKLANVAEVAKPYLAAILSGVVVRQLVESIAYQRGHSLEVRRYMWHDKY